MAASEMVDLLNEWETLPTVLLDHGAKIAAAADAGSDVDPLILNRVDLSTEDSYWRLLELKFVLRQLLANALKQYTSSLRTSSATTAVCERGEVGTCKARVDLLNIWDQAITALERAGLAALESSGKTAPRLARLAAAYKWEQHETDLVQLLVVNATARTKLYTALVRLGFDEDNLERDLCLMSPLALLRFLDDKRRHVQDGTVYVNTDYNNVNKARLIREAIMAIRASHTLTAEERLKLADTELLRLVEEDEGRLPLGGPGSSETAAGGPAAEVDELMALVAVPSADAGVNDIADDDAEVKSSTSSVASSLDMAALNRELGLPENDKGIDLSSLLSSLAGAADSGLQRPGASAAAAADEAGAASALDNVPRFEPESGGSEDEVTPYKTSLAYLDDQFQLLAAQLKLAGELTKRDLSDAISEEDRMPWQRERSRRANLRELETKVRFAQRRVEKRLELTEQSGLPPPRLEALCKALQLDDFERSVLVLCIGNTISPVMQAICHAVFNDGMSYRSDSDLVLKQILQTFCPTFKQQVSHRVYFYKTAPLIRRGIIKLWGRYTDEDILQQHVHLDRRILDFIVGLETEINEVVDGSNLYLPSVTMDQVVLPEDLKTSIVKSVTSFEAFKEYKQRHNLENFVASDHGLMILFCGISGTGKTMMVNALGNYLNKRLLRVSFSLMMGKKQSDSSSSNAGSAIQTVLREAEMHDAIVFFDECESMFAQRGSGGSDEMTELLIELERSKSMIFLATNRPMDLDEAMHRRISAVYEFPAPNHVDRKRIWEIHVNHEALKLADDIDFDRIALRYEMSGGFIKNAVMSALLQAIARDGAENPVITEQDIVVGCSLQIRGSLKSRTFANRVIPKSGLDELILSERLQKQLTSIVQLEKARSVLFGPWGWSEQMRDQQSSTCLFWGASGTGKSRAAEAIGFETGRPLKVMSFAQLLRSAFGGGGGGRSMSRAQDQRQVGDLSTAFRDASLSNAILVLENFECLLNMGEGGGSVGGETQMLIEQLVYHMERFNGVVIIIASMDKNLSLFIHHLQAEFVRRFKFLVQFDLPTAAQRTELFQRMLPAKTPRSADLDFVDLGRRFQFSGGQIARVLYIASARASLRVGSKPGEGEAGPELCMEDLRRAAQEEIDKTKGDVTDIVQGWFL